MTKLNPYQRVAAESYGGGDYRYIHDASEAEDVGDTLFTFIIRELGEAASNNDEAIHLMENAVADIECVIDALKAS